MFESVRKPNKELESIYCNSLLWWKQCWEFSQSNQSPSLFTVWFVWRGEENVCQQNTFSINSSITSEKGNRKNSKAEDAQVRTSPLDYSDDIITRVSSKRDEYLICNIRVIRNISLLYTQLDQIIIQLSNWLYFHCWLSFASPSTLQPADEPVLNFAFCET